VEKELLDFGARIAWPLVALIGVIILGVGGALDKILGNILGIARIVADFKSIATDFSKTQTQLRDSIQGLPQVNEQLLAISQRLENLRANQQDLALDFGARSIELAVGKESATATIAATENPLSTDDMFDDMRKRWYSLTDKLKDRVGPDFDARSVGQMAWRLVDKRRTSPLDESTANLIGLLQSQWKRFTRIQSSKDEWLTEDIYAAFVRGAEQAAAAL
jgi:hypothetical protein